MPVVPTIAYPHSLPIALGREHLKLDLNEGKEALDEVLSKAPKTKITGDSKENKEHLGIPDFVLTDEPLLRLPLRAPNSTSLRLRRRAGFSFASAASRETTKLLRRRAIAAW